MNETTVNLDTIQAEQTAWSLKNFGGQPAHRPMLGIIEELCELEEALLQVDGDARDEADDEAAIDAIGDVAIYMLDYCGKRGWRMQELWDARKCLPGYDDFTYGPNADGSPYVYPFIKVLAHSQLKGEQNIRGGTSAHDVKLQEMLSCVLWMLEGVATKYFEKSPLDIIADVWAGVMKRDWLKNPNNAHAVAETAT